MPAAAGRDEESQRRATVNWVRFFAPTQTVGAQNDTRETCVDATDEGWELGGDEAFYGPDHR